jgi:hypothetical protein
LPAEFSGLVEAEKAEVAELLEQLMRREDVGLFPFVDKGIDFGRDKLLQDAAGFFVIGGKKHLSVKLQSAPCLFRHGRASPGHPRLTFSSQNVDARDKPGHDGSYFLVIPGRHDECDPRISFPYFRSPSSRYARSGMTV